MRHHHETTHHSRLNGHHPRRHGLGKRIDHFRGSITDTAGKLKGKTSHILTKSLRNVKIKTKKLPKEVDRIVIKNRYQTIGAAMVAGLCIGYFIKK